MTGAREGGCQCGAVRFRARGAPKFISNCHCADCRRASGAAFSTFVGYADQQLEWTGDRKVYNSPAGAARSFCAECGSPLAYSGVKWPGETHLLVGAFDEQSDLNPTSDVFSDEALGWAYKKAKMG
ncbi:MAG: GFA family protein [Pseudomonadota bacterium]